MLQFCANLHNHNVARLVKITEGRVVEKQNAISDNCVDFCLVNLSTDPFTSKLNLKLLTLRKILVKLHNKNWFIILANGASCKIGT